MPKRRTRGEASAGSATPSVVANGPLVLSIVMSVMQDSYGEVEREFWGLSRALDLLSPRSFHIKGAASFKCYCRRLNEPGPYPIMRLYMCETFNKPLTILGGIKSVLFGENYNSPLTLCPGIEELSFYGRFNQPLGNLPESLKELSFEGRFNQPLTLPPKLKELRLRHAYRFNHPITLPDSIRYVDLGQRFDHPLVLPAGLEEVHFDVFGEEGRFNHPLMLPSSIKALSLSTSFNQPLTLPEGLLKLKIGRAFNQPLTFPSTLKSLSLECQRLDHPLHLPAQLDTQRVDYSSRDAGNDVLPSYLRNIALPPGLRVLEWYCDLPVRLPESIKRVEFGVDYDHEVELPEGMERLQICNREYRKPLVLPSTLKRIVITKHYDLPLVLPHGCTRGMLTLDLGT